MIKDIFEQEIKEGDVILRPVFSSLDVHKVVRITPSGKLVVSRFVKEANFTKLRWDNKVKKKITTKHYYYCKNNNINEHNCLLYINYTPDLFKINIDNNLDVNTLKTLNQLEICTTQ